MNFLGMGPMELMMILVLALIVFGPGKLPEIAGQVGRVVRDFRRTTSELSSEFSRTLSLEIEDRKTSQAASAAPAAPVEYEAPAADTVVHTVETAPAAAVEPTEAPPVAAAPPNLVIDTPVPAPEPVAATSPNGTSKRRTRDTGIEPPY
ncbi:MAG: twin-arginine translocase TatA/TatE family subunit [Chloroflexota bacterium]